MRAAQPIEPASRGAFLEAVAARLARTSELGEGVVFRTCAELQRLYFNAPMFNTDHGASRSRRRIADDSEDDRPRRRAQPRTLGAL
jgi:hypothetical protein